MCARSEIFARPAGIVPVGRAFFFHSFFFPVRRGPRVRGQLCISSSSWSERAASLLVADDPARSLQEAHGPCVIFVGFLAARVALQKKGDFLAIFGLQCTKIFLGAYSSTVAPKGRIRPGAIREANETS